MPSGLRPLLAPRSIAVIGASRSSAAIGHHILRNLIAQGFSGSVYPVNPQAASVCSVHAYPAIGDVPEAIDLAVIVVPQPKVLGVARECVAAGVKSLVVISAGFKEVGPQGAAAEEELRMIARDAGIRMVGPNCMGVVNTDPAVRMNATFAPAMPPFGHAAFVSQSGALGLNVLDHAREYGIGISQFVSVGNKADVSGNDLLLEWENDPSVHVILMYVENFGNPRRFLENASRITKTKPIIVVKAGRSAAGARAAASHTGALAASDTAVHALLAQAGVLRAESVQELFDFAMAFEVRALPRSRRTAVLTNAGGPGILAADAMAASGLELAELSPDTVNALRPLLPPEASIRNPLDMIASATPASYAAAMKALLADPGIDAVVPIFVPPFSVHQKDVAAAIVSAVSADELKPVLSVLMGRAGLPEGRSELHAAGIPAYIFPESAAGALAALNRQREWAERPPSVTARLTVDRAAAAAIIAKARGDRREKLQEMEALDLLAAYGIPVVRSTFAASPEEAAGVATAMGFPVAMKVVSPDVMHKSDVGGVATGLASAGDVAVRYSQMVSTVATRHDGARVTGVLIQPMVTGGRETIVGVARDARFGPLVMFGLGGILVEVLRDVVFRLTPLGEDEAASMLDEIRGSRILDGVRGEAPLDRRAIVDVLRRTAQLADDFPEIEEIDCNPLMARPDGAVVVDARVRIAIAADARTEAP
jgi:acetyltransferase